MQSKCNNLNKSMKILLSNDDGVYAPGSDNYLRYNFIWYFFDYFLPENL